MSKWGIRTKELVLLTPKVCLVLCLVSHRANVHKWYLTLLLSQSLFFWWGIVWAGCSLYIFDNTQWIFVPSVCLIFPPLKSLLSYKLCSVLLPLSWFLQRGICQIWCSNDLIVKWCSHDLSIIFFNITSLPVSATEDSLSNKGGGSTDRTHAFPWFFQFLSPCSLPHSH